MRLDDYLVRGILAKCGGLFGGKGSWCVILHKSICCPREEGRRKCEFIITATLRLKIAVEIPA
jgi:hypothetical protein